MMRLLAMIFMLAVMNVTLIISVAHDGMAASQQVAVETAVGQEPEPVAASSNASCMLSGSCSSDETACSWSCPAHGAIEIQPTQYGVALKSGKLDRLSIPPPWKTAGPALQERPPRTLSV